MGEMAFAVTMVVDKGRGAGNSKEGSDRRVEKNVSKGRAPSGTRRHPGLKLRNVPGSKGLSLRYHSARGAASKNSLSVPPVLFVPYGPHAPWGFEENALPYFARRGFPAYTFDQKGKKSKIRRPSSLDELCEQVEHVSKALPSPPVLIGHGPGGFVAQACIQRGMLDFPGAVLSCSVPPSGSLPVLFRHFLKSPADGAKRLCAALEGTAYLSTDTMREAFFSDNISERKVRSYLNRAKKGLQIFGHSAHLSYTLFPLRKNKEVVDNFSGRIFILGAENDYWVDPTALSETSTWWSGEQSKPTLIKGSAHDYFLDDNWRKASDEIISWLQRLVAADELLNLVAGDEASQSTDLEF